MNRARVSSALLLGAGWVLAVGACSDPGPRPPPDYGTAETDTIPAFYGRVPKNVFMISMDTFRKDHLDRYGEVGKTPFLSAVADAGYAFDDHVQCSNWTYASTSCTLAGRYNEESGMIPQLVSGFEGRYPVGTPFLASYLHDSLGTYGIIASTNGWLGAEWGNTGGYVESFHPVGSTAWEAYTQGRERLDSAIGRGEDRWMLHVHLTEPHASYDPPAEYLKGLEGLEPVPYDLANRDQQYTARADWPTMTDEEQALLLQHLNVRYEGELAWMDDQIFQMIADMDFDGLLDDTLVVFWTDHGEQFFEHGYQTHAYTLYREENDALLFLWAKNIVPGAWSGPTSAIDMVPTLLALYGVDQPLEVTGYAVGTAPEDRPRFAHTVARLGVASSIMKGPWKMTFSWFGVIHLYDLDADPAEQVDLYDRENPSDEARALWAELRPQIEQQAALLPEYAVAWPPELTDPVSR
ncbi:MAG: sulfatase-like hydrolase/transferase [Myxococcota bacterium]